MRRPLPPSADASAMEKVCSAEGASNSGDAVAGERRAAATEHNSRGSALGVWGGQLGRRWRQASTDRGR